MLVLKDFKKLNRGGSMKKGYLFLGILGFFVLSMAAPAYSWQGRMAGMADPFGLISDESDFLIHPSKICQGKGITFYGDYRFTYTDVRDWNNHMDLFSTAGAFLTGFHFNSSGEEYKHNALLGAAFPLGPGRLGAFFSFESNRGDYDGYDGPYTYSMGNKLDDLSFSLIYGLPINKLDFGIQLGVDYRNEQKKWLIDNNTQNDVWPTDYPYNLHFFMNPYDSNYWEMFWKVSMGTRFNAVSFDWTVRGSYIIDSDNKYEYTFGIISENVDMKGDVEGYRIGSDIWLRYDLGDGLTLPFLLSADYAKKVRDGDGIGVGFSDTGDRYTYKHSEWNLEVKVGGGVEKKMNANGLIGVGLYYHYLEGREHQWFNNRDWVGGPYFYDYINFPLHKEHRLEMKVAGELEISPTVTLRMGLSSFYGWVGTHNFKQTSSLAALNVDEFSLDGYVWGINASLGSTVKISRFSLEPFINGGYRSLKLSGDGDTNSAGTLANLWNMELKRNEWLIGGGFSIKF
jgi:hypothetical protein